MKIKFLVDFRGRETNERYYQSGQVVELPDDIASRLIADKRAVEVIEKKESIYEHHPHSGDDKRKRRGGRN